MASGVLFHCNLRLTRTWMQPKNSLQQKIATWIAAETHAKSRQKGKKLKVLSVPLVLQRPGPVWDLLLGWIVGVGDKKRQGRLLWDEPLRRLQPSIFNIFVFWQPLLRNLSWCSFYPFSLFKVVMVFVKDCLSLKKRQRLRFFYGEAENPSRCQIFGKSEPMPNFSPTDDPAALWSLSVGPGTC